MKIINNPFEKVIQAVKELYSDTEAVIQFNPNLRGSEYRECGCTTFPEDNSIPIIDISTNIPFEAMIEILAHELAHVVVGKEAGHKKEWEAVFDKIQEKYIELVSKDIEERGKPNESKSDI